MATKATEKDVLALEKKYWQAMKDNDMATALSLTADPCLLTGPQGADLVDHKTFTEMFNMADYQLESYQFTGEFKVKLLNDKVAVIAYPVHLEMRVKGDPVSIDAADTSTWVRSGGTWQCAQHSEAIIGDPFGRDRCPEQ